MPLCDPEYIMRMIGEGFDMATTPSSNAGDPLAGSTDDYPVTISDNIERCVVENLDEKTEEHLNQLCSEFIPDQSMSTENENILNDFIYSDLYEDLKE